MKTSIILKRARKHLSKDWLDGICSAIDDVQEETHERHNAKFTALYNLIEARIQPFAYAHSWLGWKMTNPNVKPDRCGDLPPDVYDIATAWKNSRRISEIQAWRHAWLNELIKEFEAKGD